MAYDAFISYSHGQDSGVAEAVQRGLQRLARPWNRRSALKVFRDSTALSANPGLWTSISDAMEDSGHLVVLCSPEAAASPWVAREIEHWQATKPPGRIVPVLTAGELVWSDELGGFDPARSTALIPALHGAFSEEPLFVDMREARSSSDLTLRDPRWKDQIADIAAPIHGLPKDELVGEDIRQHRRALRLAWGAAIALVLLTLGTVVGASQAVANANAKVKAEQSLAETEAQVAQAQEELDATNSSLSDARAEVKVESAKAEKEAALAVDATKKAAAADASARAAQDQAFEANEQAADANESAESARQGEVNAKAGQATAERLRNDAVLEQVRAVRDREAARTLQLVAEDRAAQAARQEVIAVAATIAERAARDVAVEERNTAIDDREAAIGQKRAAEADARIVGLAAAAGSPVTPLDQSLLLAAAASRVDGGSGERQEAHASLLDAAARADGVRGFLAFTDEPVPQTLGDLTVSPDGRFVAAVDVNDDVRTGGQPASTSVYVWRGDDVTRARPVALPREFDCLSLPPFEEDRASLQWLTGGVLVTVEQIRSAPDSCAAEALPAPESLQELAVPFAAKRVTLWDVTVDPPAAYDLGELILPDSELPGYAVADRAPVEVSPDHTRIWITYDLSEELGRSTGTPISVLFDTVTGRVGLETAHPANLFRDRKIFSEGSRYASAWGPRGPMLFDLDNWTTGPGCSSLLADQVGGCFVEIRPNTPDVRAEAPLVAADEGSFVLPNGTGTGLTRFSATGSSPQTGPELPEGVVDYAVGTDVVVVRGIDGLTRSYRWSAPGQATELPVRPGDGCWLAPDVGPDDALLIIQETCPVGSGDLTRVEDVFGHSTHVVRTSDLRATVIDRPGRATHLDGAGRLVVQSLAADTTRGFWSTFEAWDLSPANPGGRQIARVDDRRAVVTPDGKNLISYKPNILSSAPRDVQIQPMDGSLAPKALAGSVGVSSIGFDAFGTVFGVGTTGSGRVWEPGRGTATEDRRASFATSVFTDPTPPCLDGTTLLRSVLTPDGSRRAVSRDARTIALGAVGAPFGTRLPDLPLAATERIAYFTFSKSMENLSLLVTIERSNETCQGGELVGSFIVQLRQDGRDLGTPSVSPRLAQLPASTSLDGRRALMVDPSFDRAIVREVASGQEVGRIDTTDGLTADGLRRFLLSPDGALVIGADERGTAAIWRVDGRRVSVLRPSSPAESRLTSDAIGLAMRRDGRELAVKTRDQRLLVWDVSDVESPVLRGSLQLPDDAFAHVAYSPDGTLIAVDGTYLIDARTVTRIGPRIAPAEWDTGFLARQNGSEQLLFITGPDGGSRLIAARAERAVRWSVDVESLQRRVCDIAGRNFTRAEFGEFGIGDPYRASPCPGLPAGSP